MRLRTLVALGVLTVVVLTLLTQFGIPTTFSTSAETQVVTVVVANGFRHEWFLNGATLTLTGSDGTNERSVLSDAIRPLPGAKVTLSRIGSGPLVLVIEGKDKQPVVILPGERTFTGRVDVVHRLSSDHDLPGRLPTVLPVSGRITLGAEVNDGFSERPLMLLEGSTTMLSHTVLGSLRYEAGRVELDPGDLVTLEGAGDAYGLVTAGDANLSTVMRVDARAMKVVRYGSDGYSFYASLLVRLSNDPVIQAVWAGAGLMFAALGKLPLKKKEGRRAKTR